MRDELRRKLTSVFRRHPDIQAVYLFGSTAEGRARPESDIDLAVIASSSRIKEKKLDILSELAQVGMCNVDLVFLNDQDLVLQYEAVRQNQLVYAREDFDRGATYSKIVRKYLDFEPYLRAQRAAYKRRIAGAQA